MYRISRIAVIVAWLLTTGSAFGATYYVSTSGSDSANGTSTTSPWAHAPGMVTCSATCAATTLQAGDRVIFHGGDTWGHANFVLTITWSGTTGNPIYFGVDQTWYNSGVCGASWCRPIFSGDHTTLASGDGIVRIWNQNYVTLDNIEIKGHTSYNNWGPASVEVSCDQYVTLTNLYVHDWALDSSVTSDDAHGGIFGNSPSCSNVGTVVDHSLITNTEQTGVRQNGVAVRAVDVQYSTIHDVSTSQLFGRVHDSLLYNVSYPSGNASFDSNYHTNVTYVAWGDASQHSGSDQLYLIYNNVIHDFNAGSGGIYPNDCSDSAHATYVYNNVIYNNWTGGNPNVQIDPYGSSSGCGFFYIWNNTLQEPSGGGASLVRVVNRGFPIGTLTLEDNQYVTDGTVLDTGAGVNTLTQDHNVTQTNAQATSAGYTSSQTYPYSPTASNSPTVGQGADLTSNCSTAAALCSDTSDGSIRTPVARPSTGAWDSGAYEYEAGSDPPPNPPTGLAAIVK
jgi:hypothetical protein